MTEEGQHPIYAPGVSAAIRHEYELLKAEVEKWRSWHARADSEAERYLTRCEQLAAALEPFARFADALNGEWDEGDQVDADEVGGPVWSDEETVGTEVVSEIPEPRVGDYRRARELLSKAAAA